MRAVGEAGIDPGETYVTNAVKHFKFSQRERGKRRIHKPPTLRETTACRPWPDAELDVIDPDVVVALGATAGRALLGASFRVTRQRGLLLPGPGARRIVATIHPSAVLRAPTDEDRAAACAGLVSDLRVAAGALR